MKFKVGDRVSVRDGSIYTVKSVTRDRSTRLIRIHLENELDGYAVYADGGFREDGVMSPWDVMEILEDSGDTIVGGISNTVEVLPGERMDLPSYTDFMEKSFSDALSALEERTPNTYLFSILKESANYDIDPVNNITMIAGFKYNKIKTLCKSALCDEDKDFLLKKEYLDLIECAMMALSVLNDRLKDEI